MYIAYFDEVKPNLKHGQPYYLVAGVLIRMEHIAEIEGMMSALSTKFFGTPELLKESEFHASDIYFAKGRFKNYTVEARLEILQAVAEVLGVRDKVQLVYACIDTTKLFNGVDPAKTAFMHFVERVDLAIDKDSFAILIGDLDDEQVKMMVADFAKYRTVGTHPTYGRLINRIVDSVHFCHSHHSRMIQLADMHAFIVSGRYRKRTGLMADELYKRLEKIPLFPTRYKKWPN